MRSREESDTWSGRCDEKHVENTDKVRDKARKAERGKG